MKHQKFSDGPRIQILCKPEPFQVHARFLSSAPYQFAFPESSFLRKLPDSRRRKHWPSIIRSTRIHL